MQETLETLTLEPWNCYLCLRTPVTHVPGPYNGGAGRRQRNGREEQLSGKIEALEAKLTKKDNVIAEISEEFVRLKKELGEP